MPREEDWTPPTWTRCQFCKCLWEPYYGTLSINDEVAPAIIVYTCINCLPKKNKKDAKKKKAITGK